MEHDYYRNSTQRTYWNKYTEEEEECTGFMDVPINDTITGRMINHPSVWSDCSVKDFRKAYKAKNWGNTCFKGIIIQNYKIY